MDRSDTRRNEYFPFALYSFGMGVNEYLLFVLYSFCMGVGLSVSEGAEARRRAAGIRGGGTHEPTNGFKMTEVGEEDRVCVVVVFGWTISMLSTGTALGGGVWGECESRARIGQQQS